MNSKHTLFELCGNCGLPLIEVRWAWSCVACDLMLEWPTVEHDQSVIRMAHIAGIGRLERRAS